MVDHYVYLFFLPSENKYCVKNGGHNLFHPPPAIKLKKVGILLTFQDGGILSEMAYFPNRHGTGIEVNVSCYGIIM
jgi:hypothetical protein